MFAAPPGFVTTFRRAGSSSLVRIFGRVGTIAGETAAKFWRVFQRDRAGELFVRHEWLRVVDRFQRMGIGSTLLRNAVEGYRRLGVRYVLLRPDGAGAVVWPKYGFVPYGGDLVLRLDQNGGAS
jgi:GNAT superfamily N-acetyltransferase